MPGMSGMEVLKKLKKSDLTSDVIMLSGQGETQVVVDCIKLGATEFVVDSVTFLGDGYTFSLSSDNLPEGVTPYLEIVDSSLSPYQFDNEASTQAPDGDKVLYTITLTTGSTPPTGNLTVNWGLDEFTPKEGPWSLVWTPSTTSP
jgi:hypothetical protein